MAAKKGKTADEITAEKSDVKDVEDGKFRKEFVFQVTRDQTEEDVLNSESMNEGNRQSTLQNALIRGVHPKGEPVVESVEIVHEGINSKSVKVTYAVEALPAVLDLDPESTTLPVRREADRRETVRLARLRAASDPAGFDAA
jgi:hypothetical protein